MREYLEIDPRIRVLNERCRVFLDLAEILCDSDADAKMSSITWIIIVLIFVSILVTVSEVLLRFGMLAKAAGRGGDGRREADAKVGGAEWSSLARQDGAGIPLVGSLRDLRLPPSVVRGLDARALDELRKWSASLGERERAAVCGADYVGPTFVGV